ncbi:MAG TPA: hypothetical protein VLL52_25185 [Anaerolineae bacterium]|nr:hypothetical protein [Anaerolineae bacterium]
MSDKPKWLLANGINGATGGYDLPPIKAEDLVAVIKGQDEPPATGELRNKADKKDHFGVMPGYDITKVGDVGWGIVFDNDANPAIREALTELIAWRQSQAGERFQEYWGPEKAFRRRDDKTKFLDRNGAATFGPVNPRKAPYYMLLVGGPEQIPYRFQTELDVQYGVGRVDFGDDLDAYANYARSVVTAEKEKIKLQRRIGLWGPATADDPATLLSHQLLLTPLAGQLRKERGDWTIDSYFAEQGTRAQLAELLSGGAQTPSLLFTASHGMGFPKGDKRQLPHQGALLAHDWPGPRQHRGEVPESFYLAGEHLDSNTNLLGMIGFLFACYGAGTPEYDEYSKQAFADQAEAIAERAFTSALPAKMMSLKRGGALAMLGHVDRAWGYSFLGPKSKQQTDVFEALISQLLDGVPVGAAFDYFNVRYAEMATALTTVMENMDARMRVDPYDVANLWTSHNDARGYVVLGDPAVQLQVAKAGERAEERPVMKAVTVSAPKAAAPKAAAVEEGMAAKDGVENEVTEEGKDPEAGVDYNIMGRLLGGDRGDKSGSEQPVADTELRSTVKGITTRVVNSLERVVEQVTTLDVATYTLTEGTTGKEDVAELRAAGQIYMRTILKLDGDTETFVARKMKPDDPLLAIHEKMVVQAQEQRAEMIKTLASAVASLANIFK